jgi:hypothetical protein
VSGIVIAILERAEVGENKALIDCSFIAITQSAITKIQYPPAQNLN